MIARLICIPLLIAAHPLLAADIVAAAASPYALPRFVETHANFEWDPLWAALKIDAFLPACRDAAPCGAELITVPDPDQRFFFLSTVLLTFRFSSAIEIYKPARGV